MEETKELSELTRQERVSVTQADIREIKSEVSILSNQFRQVYDAIVGNAMTKDGGLVQRIIDTECELEKVKLRVLELERRETKAAIYVNIIYGTCGIIVSLIVNFFIKMFS